MEEQLFDRGKEFEVPIMSGGVKRCVVRWPTDAEWCERTRKQAIVKSNLGRGKSTTDVLNAKELDAALFAKIRIDKDGPEFDDADAVAVIRKLGRCELLGPEDDQPPVALREGDNFRIRFKVPKATVVHVLRGPRQVDIQRYSAASVGVPVDERNHQTFRFKLEPAGELYDAIKVESTGYADGVPITHKEAAIAALLQALQIEDEDPEL